MRIKIITIVQILLITGFVGCAKNDAKSVSPQAKLEVVQDKAPQDLRTSPEKSEGPVNSKNPEKSEDAKNSDEAQKLIPLELKKSIYLNRVRKALFDQINFDRANFGLKPLHYDKTAETAGNKHNRSEAEIKHQLGHFSTNGETPYMRYSQVGGYDENIENWSSANIHVNSKTEYNAPQESRAKCPTLRLEKLDQNNIEEAVTKVALHLQCEMLNELPGHDGHRQAILNPIATGVGIGIALALSKEPTHMNSKLMVFITAEFTTKLLTQISPLPYQVSLKESKNLNFSGTVPEGFSFDQLSMHFEKPEAMTPDEAASYASYELPKNEDLFYPIPPPGKRYSDQTYKKNPTLKPVVQIEGQNFTVPLSFIRGPGVYTLVVWITPEGSSQPIPATRRSIVITK